MYIVNALKNLPMTSEKIELGDVKRSCSVLVLFSSLKLRIVKMGKKTIITKRIIEK